MSYKLEIKNDDGSTYWIEHFKTLEKANEWLEEEQKRPYWKPVFTHSIVELVHQGPTQEEVDIKNSIDAAKLEAKKVKQALNACKTANDLASTQQALIKVAKALHNLVKCLGVVDPKEAE